MDCSERDRFHIVAIVRALRDARRFMGDLSFEAFAESDEKQNAVAMAIARCGEHIKRLSKEFRDAEPGVEWRGIAGMRDWIAHDYEGLDFESLHYAVTVEVPKVLAALDPYLESFAEIRQESADPFNVPRV